MQRTIVMVVIVTNQIKHKRETETRMKTQGHTIDFERDLVEMVHGGGGRAHLDGTSRGKQEGGCEMTAIANKERGN